MPATVRGLYRPRRRLIKPRGRPRLISSLAPRGLVLCAPLSDPSFGAIYAGTVGATGSFALSPTATSSPALTATPRGPGLRLSGGVTCLSYQMPSVQPPNTWSMEALIWVDSPTVEGSICGFNQSSDGSSGTFDRDIGTNLNGTGNWQVYLYDGAAKSANGPVSSTTGFLHFVATADGSNLRFYYNGLLQNTTVVASGGYAAYSPPVYFCIGRPGGNSSVPFTSCTVLLVNLAKVCWTPAEVQERYLNPFGFLAWPEDRRHYLVGVAAGGATSYSFPTKSWTWNHQAPALALSSTSTQKAWVWNHQAPTLAFASTSTQKAWAWAKGAPSLGFATAAAQKAWAWVGGAPILPRTIAAAQKAWRWAAASPTMTGGNFNPLAAVLRYLGPVWKRRRSRPPL